RKDCDYIVNEGDNRYDFIRCVRLQYDFRIRYRHGCRSSHEELLICVIRSARYRVLVFGRNEPVILDEVFKVERCYRHRLNVRAIDHATTELFKGNGSLSANNP